MATISQRIRCSLLEQLERKNAKEYILKSWLMIIVNCMISKPDLLKMLRKMV